METPDNNQEHQDAPEQENPLLSKGLLTAKNLSDRWNLSPETLRNWRKQGVGPVFMKLVCRVFYRLEDIEAFEKERLYKSSGHPVNPKRK